MERRGFFGGVRLQKARRLSLAAASAGVALIFIAGLGEPASAQMGSRHGFKKEEEKIPTGPSGPVEQQFPFGATWVLTDINGKPISGDPPSFNLDDKLRATGFGGCNTFSMTLYPIREQKLAAGAIALTKKSCGKPTDDVERTMLVSLHSLPKWHLETTGDLTLTLQGGTLHFRRGL